MMETKTIFLLDDEFPKIKEFIDDGIYQNAINADSLYHLALYEHWGALSHLQQLIKNIVTSEAYKIGMINLIGYSQPEIALYDIENGVSPDIIIYDWQYGGVSDDNNSQGWLKDLLNETNAFIFVYSQIEQMLPKFLNKTPFSEFANRFQLFEKGGKNPLSFSAEEFIFQYIISSAVKKGHIIIDGIRVEFTSNNYLAKASDILYLQRILGYQFVLDELKSVDFSIDTASVEKILNDSDQFLLVNYEKEYLITPENQLVVEHNLDLEKISYLEVVKKYSISVLEEVLDRGILYL